MAIIDNFSVEELTQIVEESFSYREVLKKLGYATSGGNNNKTLRSRLEKYHISTDHFRLTGEKGIERNEENVFCENSTASQSTLRRWFVKGEYIEYKCDECGLEGHWNGRPLALQLDHINGDNHDNRLENLHWLCPNCHSQTDTFCGKQTRKNHSTKEGITNKVKEQNHCLDCGKPISYSSTRCPECAAKIRRTIDRPDKDTLYRMLIDNKGNFTQIGRLYKTTDNTIRKWCKGYDLPTHSSDYK